MTLPLLHGPVSALLFRLWRQHGARVLRYGVVGVGISVLYSLAVIAAVHLLAPLSPTKASIVAFAVMLPVTYIAHRDITFGDRVRDPFQPARFAMTTISSFSISIGGMYWITEVWHQTYLLGIAWNWLVIPGINFVIFMIWVFRDRTRAAPPANGHP